MIVITDGESHDRDKLNATAWGLRDKGITVFAVGVGDANKDELETMAGKKENTIHVDNFDKLRDIYMPLQETLCNSSQESKLLSPLLIVYSLRIALLCVLVIFTSTNSSQALISPPPPPASRLHVWVSHILMDVGPTTSATSLKETDSTTPKSYLLRIAPQLRVEACDSLSPPQQNDA